MEKIRTLLVDDDSGILEIFTEILESLGHEVVTASYVKEAISRFDLNSDFNLVITDYNMPDGTGAELVEAYVGFYDTTPKFILITGDLAGVSKMELLAFDKIITKPLAVAKFISAIKEVLS